LVAIPQVPELPWIEKTTLPPVATLITSPKQSFVKPEDAEVVSDTGELRRNWESGTYLINTPHTQSAMGWIGGQTIKLADVELRATTRNATIAVQSLDGKPIGSASSLLISLGARSQPRTENKLPFHSEPVEGQISIRASPGLKLYARSGAAERVRLIPSTYSGGRYRINLDRTTGSHWLFLR
jgi:hypothetical protein